MLLLWYVKLFGSTLHARYDGFQLAHLNRVIVASAPVLRENGKVGKFGDIVLDFILPLEGGTYSALGVASTGPREVRELGKKVPRMWQAVGGGYQQTPSRNHEAREKYSNKPDVVPTNFVCQAKKYFMARTLSIRESYSLCLRSPVVDKGFGPSSPTPMVVAIAL